MWLYAYARKSRALGDRDETSVVAHQLIELKRIAEADGFSLTEEQCIAEIGSGEDLEQRPRFQRLLLDLERQPPPGGGRLYVTEIPRLSRAHIEEIGRIMRILTEAGVQVAIPGRCLDLGNSRDEQFFIYEAAQGRQEVRRYKERNDLKMKATLLTGAFRRGKACFGYIWDTDLHAPRPHPENFDILKRCCQEVLSHSCIALARKYGVSVYSLRRALSNPVICGYPCWRSKRATRIRSGRENTTVLPRHEWRWPQQQNTAYPHACSREEWEQIQCAIAARQRLKKKTVYEDGWCRDIVRFVRDGEEDCRAILGSFSLRHKPQFYLSYKGIPPVGNSHYINREVVHEAALRALRQVFAEPERLCHVHARYRQHQRDRAIREAGGDGSIDQLARQITAAQIRYRGAVEAELDADSARFRAIARERRLLIEAQIERAEADLSAKMDAALRTDTTDILLHRLDATRPNWLATWEECGQPERRQLATAVLESIRVRCTPQEGKQAWQREVIEVVLQPWFR